MKTLLIRAASALVAGLLLWAIIANFGATGLLIAVAVVVVLGIREGARILFANDSSMLSWAFTILSVFLFLFGIVNFEFTSAAFALLFVCLFPFFVLTLDSLQDLDRMSKLLSKATLGLCYLALLPLFACHLFNLDHGMIWFLALLAFVFAGDTMAYLIGWKFGKRLLLPSISPKKTQEGSVGGLLGSALAGYLLSFALPHIPVPLLIALALVVGALGQMGDLFESLLKRVANQKDSGSLMPGHGGVLDRIDGVLFGAPMMFVGASLLEKWF